MSPPNTDERPHRSAPLTLNVAYDQAHTSVQRHTAHRVLVRLAAATQKIVPKQTVNDYKRLYVIYPNESVLPRLEVNAPTGQRETVQRPDRTPLCRKLMTTLRIMRVCASSSRTNLSSCCPHDGDRAPARALDSLRYCVLPPSPSRVRDDLVCVMFFRHVDLHSERLRSA